jgi:hypothetical protein
MSILLRITHFLLNERYLETFCLSSFHQQLIAKNLMGFQGISSSIYILHVNIPENGMAKNCAL